MQEPRRRRAPKDVLKGLGLFSGGCQRGRQPGASSYPISGYSWALVYTHQQNQATGQALVAMLDWLTHDGQAYAAADSYVPLPPEIQQLARTMLQQVTGPAGTHLLS